MPINNDLHNEHNGSSEKPTKPLNTPLDKLAISIEHLADKVDDFMAYSKNSVHIKVVVIMFSILVLSIIGVQGANFVFKQYLPKVLGIPD